jgi:antirestriction protein ArdC
MPAKPDVYTRVTDKIIADLERGNLTWQQPWQAGHQAGSVSRPLRAEGKPYRGVNVMMLWASALEKGYSAPIWMTYNQAAEIGGQVRKGETGTLVVYAATFTKTVTDDKGQAEEKDIPFMKGYTVFNVEQIDGLPGHFYATNPPPGNAIDRLDAADRFFAATGATIRHGGASAFYSPGQDIVQMPPLQLFRDQESYYATLGHEAVHWTRHPARLDREFGRKRFGDAGYAMEELVAEIGAAYLCADLGITPETRPDHAAYIGSWLKVLKNDKRAIFTAASHADRAAEHLHGYQSPAQDAGRQPSAAASDYARTLDDTARRAQPRGQDRSIDR